MNIVFTENDYEVLKAILDRGDTKKGLCKSVGTTISELVAKTGLSDKKVRNSIKAFKAIGFVSDGIAIGRTRTYVLTEEGFEELNNIRKNIFGGM